MNNSNFHTFQEYMKKGDNSLTASMEDYIEMLYRLSAKSGFTRINELSQALNVQPPSATKMVQRLSGKGYLKYEKYGVLILEDKGKQIGERLIQRHMIIENFMRIIGVSDSLILQETEKIEHTLSGESTTCIENLVNFMINNPEITNQFKTYILSLSNSNHEKEAIV